MIKSNGKIIGLSALVICVFILLFTTLRFTIFSVVGTLYGVFQPASVNVSDCLTNNLSDLKEKQSNQFLWKTKKQEYMQPLFVLGKTQIFVLGNCANNFGYYEFDLLTGKKQETFPNMPKKEYAEERIQIDTRFNSEQSSSAYPIYFVCSRQKITAIQTLPEGNKILWEHNLPFDGGNTTEFSSWNGMVQYEDVIVYTAFTVVYRKMVKDIFIRAISKETGEIVWEIENPARGTSIVFEERETGATPKFDHIYLFEVVSSIKDFHIHMRDTVYGYNTATKKLQWKKKLGIEPFHLILNQNPRMYYYGETFFSTIFRKYYYYGLNTQTGRKTDQGAIPIRYGSILNCVTPRRLYVVNETSNMFYSLHKFSKKPIWFAYNATGYSTVLNDNTMVLILENRYICHIEAESGNILKYWDVKELIGTEYRCCSLEHFRGNNGYNCFTISEEGILYVLVKGEYPDSKDGHDDKFQELLAISLE